MDGLISYVSTMEQSIPAAFYHHYCFSGAINALLSHYATIFEKASISFDCQMQLPCLKRVSALHLCVILGNALQNALEAMEKMDSGKKRFLILQAVRAEDRMAITISNPFSGSIPHKNDKFPLNNKKNPEDGFGLASIQETVKRYDGWYNIDSSDQIFTMQFVLKDETSQ